MRGKLVPMVASGVAVALVALLVYGLTKQGTSRALDQALIAGRTPPAPDTTLPLPVLNGVRSGHASLASWRGKVLVVNFWASWCSTCIAEAAVIERAQHSLAASSAGTVIGIDYKDLSSGARDYIAHHRLTYPNLRDIDGGFASAYGTVALPETFVLNRKLQVVAISRGAIADEAKLAGWIAEAERA